MRRLIAFLSSVIAIVFGVLTLAGLLAGDDLGFLTTFAGLLRLRELASAFLQLVVITAAVTVIVGLLNLFVVHAGRITRGRRGWPYSLVMLISAILVIVLTAVERAGLLPETAGDTPPSAILLETVEVALESSLAALLLFPLVLGASRLLRRVTWTNGLFTLVVLVVLLGALPLPGPGISLLAAASDWLMAVPVSAGARGILLGIALATVVAGIRVLLGQDRSYRD